VSFSNPEVFWALLLLIPAGLLLYTSHLQGKQELMRIGGAWRGHRLHSVYLLKGFFSGLLLVATFLLLITAWAGPSWGRAPVEEPQDGLDIAIAFDVSRSMTAADVLPSRLDQAREVVRMLVSAFPAARFSLVAFEGQGVTLTPLTPDKEVLNRWLDELSPNLTTSPGSNLASGLDEALRTVGYSSLHHRVVILLSDGESRDGNLLASARRAAAQGIEVFTLGFGTPEGAKIPDRDGFLKDDFGFPVVTKRVDDNLKLVASESGGKFFGGTDRGSQRELQDVLATLGNPASRGGVRLETVPRYRVFLLLALVTLSGFLLVRIVPWKGIF
jgi:Ca-activated chloride channel family protein